MRREVALLFVHSIHVVDARRASAWKVAVAYNAAMPAVMAAPTHAKPKTSSKGRDRAERRDRRVIDRLSALCANATETPRCPVLPCAPAGKGHGIYLIIERRLAAAFP